MWLVTVVVVVVVGVAVPWFRALAVFAGHDHIDLLDSDAVEDVATHACTDVVASIDGTGDDRRASLVAGDAAIARLIERMDRLEPAVLDADIPASAWTDDWRAVAAARQAVLDALDAGQDRPFVMPLTPDGYPVDVRMAGALSTCADAVRLATTP